MGAGLALAMLFLAGASDAPPDPIPPIPPRNEEPPRERFPPREPVSRPNPPPAPNPEADGPRPVLTELQRRCRIENRCAMSGPCPPCR